MSIYTPTSLRLLLPGGGVEVKVGRVGRRVLQVDGLMVGSRHRPGDAGAGSRVKKDLLLLSKYLLLLQSMDLLLLLSMDLLLLLSKDLLLP